MEERIQFRRNIGLFLAVMIGIGAMMGPGVFALPGVLARTIGPLGILVYLAMGILTLLTALNYSELGAAIPLAGGGYSFTSRTLPRPLSFFTGWFFWIGNTLACAMYAVIFALTIRTYFWPEASVTLIAVATTVAFTALNIRGMAEAIKVITIMNLVELAVLVGVAILGASHVEAPNLEPLAPMGWGPFFPSMALIYISYVGFELITVASEEIVDPGRTIPRSILITLAAGTAIYVFVVWVMMGAVSYSDLGESDVPFVYVADHLFGPWGRWAGISATIMASLSALSVTLGASARVLYALGRDAHFPPTFARLHRRFRTPHVALLACAAVIVAFASSGIVEFVASVSDFGYLMGLGIVNLSVIAMRRKMKNLRRPFSVWPYPLVPLLGAASCWMFVPALETDSFVLGGGLTVLGAAVYLTQPANRSELSRLPAGWSRFRLWLRSRRKKRMRVLIIGGGSKGRSIASRLLARDEARLVFRTAEHQISFVESDPKRCAELERQFGVPIFEGDGTKKEILMQADPASIDVAIAASDDDGRNVIIALQAKQLGIGQVIALVNDPDYLRLVEENDVVAISAPWATAAMVEDYLDRPGVSDLFEIGTGVVSLIGVIVPEDAFVAGQMIRDLPIPQECVVAAVIRGKKFVVPRGGTEIATGDHVVCVGPPTPLAKARELFTRREEP